MFFVVFSTLINHNIAVLKSVLTGSYAYNGTHQ